MQFRKLRIIPLTIIVVSFLLFFGSSNAQLASFNFQLAPSLEFAQIVYVSDFDFYQQGATQFLFQLDMINGNQPVTGYLDFKIRHDNELLAQTISNVFSLEPMEEVHASNILLNAGYPLRNGEIRFDKTNTTNPSSEFEEEVLTGGKLPRGIYDFEVAFKFTSGETIDGAEASIVINNPTFIRPITPGTRAGGQYLEILYTQFPTFQFETDLEFINLDQPPFRVQIFKKLDQHASVDEVLTTQPHYDEWVSNVVFPYPPYAAQPLDPGVYFWRVNLGLITTSGTEVIESPVFAFRIEDPSRLGETDDEGMKNEVMRILEDLLGNRGRQISTDLSDYKLIAIRVNGETITKKRLYEIIDGYQGQERLISDIMLKSTQ